ncbi:MAG: RNA polymerase sigma factor [Gammaproteobacteria bacterium]|nr:RNA polymerase sigma factor [Gammaproteobacteria bacterium]
MEAASVPLSPSETQAVDQGDSASLAARAQDGDIAAFEQLYRRHAGRVHAVCLRILADRSTAEECTQDTFVRAWGALGKFRSESSFATWLTRIAINTALQRLKLERRHLRLVQPGDTEFMESHAAPDEAPDVDMDMEKLIATLPPAARTVFVLHAVEGYSHEEIAGMTGIAEGTCKAHVHRARQLLQARLQT